MTEKYKVYKCLNPVGIQIPVDTLTLAPRLNTLDSKDIWLSICGEPDITIALERQLKMDYHNVNRTLKKKYVIDQNRLSEEEKKLFEQLIFQETIA